MDVRASAVLICGFQRLACAGAWAALADLSCLCARLQR